MQSIFNIKEIVKDAKRIGITGHERPDGDCIGSTLGLYNYIKKIVDSDVVVDLFLEKLGPRYSYLKSYDCVNSEYGRRERYDVFFGLDSSTPDRYGMARQYFEEANVSVCIDHHISNDGFGKLMYIDGAASSASELVYRLIPDEDIAVCLYSGIISDTGVLQYSNTSPETLRIVARLIEYGFNFQEIIDKTFYEKTYKQNLLLGRALMESVRFLNEQAIFSVVDRKTMAFYDAQPKDLDGIVNQLLLTKDVHCAVFLYEVADLEYKVSMRADDRVDVSRIAKIFSGGGHKKAAGCTMTGTMYDVINNISLYIEEELHKENSNA